MRPRWRTRSPRRRRSSRPKLDPSEPQPSTTASTRRAMAGAELAQGRRRLPAVSLTGVAVPIVAIVIAVLIGTLVIVATGGDPTVAFPALVNGAVGTQNNLVATLVRAVP